VITQNIEGFSVTKGVLLANLYEKEKCHMLCVQKVHRNEVNPRPKIPGMNLVIELPHSKYGSAIYPKPGLMVKSAATRHNNQIEILNVNVVNCTITSVYKLPNTDFIFEKLNNFNNCDSKIVLGDFNSHNIT